MKKKKEITNYELILGPGEGCLIGLDHVKYTFPKAITLKRGDFLDFHLTLQIDESGVAQVEDTKIYIIRGG